MKKEAKKLKTLLGISIAILVLFCFVIIGLVGSIYSISYYFRDLNNTNDYFLNFFQVMFASFGLSLLVVFFILTALCVFILNLVGSILIFSIRWESDWCKNNKTLWGILSLFVLSWIGMFVFVFKGKKELKKEEQAVSSRLYIENWPQH